MAKKTPPPAPKKTDPHGALTNRALQGLKTVKDALDAEAREAAEAEKAHKAAATARGELEARKRTATAAESAKPSPRRADAEVWRPDLDKHLYEIAMAGVVPLKDGAPRVSARDPAAPERKRRPPVETALKRAHAEGADAIPVRVEADGRVVAARRGHEFSLEALGRFVLPEETLDLHRLDATEATARVLEFVRTRRQRGLRCVAVVHGRGKRSPDGQSVLADAVVAALKDGVGAADIDAFTTAPDDLGGAGSLLVALRGAR